MVEEKVALRKEIRSALVALPMGDKILRSQDIAREIKKHLLVRGARVVALFSPLADEPQLWPLVEELSEVMLVALPRVEGCVMNFYPFSPDAMVSGAFGVLEPRGGEPLQPHEIDAVVVPGVAFTRGGARMGRGKGFYDKYLSQRDFCGLKIGVCYKEQVVGWLPVEPHDVAVDIVVCG